MKYLSILLLCAFLAASAQQTALTNDSIVKMVKAQLSDDVIVSTIKSQLCIFRLGVDDLVALKQAGVSDKVIGAMVDRSNAGAAAGAAAQPAPDPAPAPVPSAAPPPAAGAVIAPTLRSVRKVFIEKMPNDLDQYLRAEISKQCNGRLTVVLDKSDADGILAGVSEEEKGTGAKITGRYLGLHDIATGSVSLLDKEGKVILWANEAGDRSLLFGAMKRGGERKVAERLISKLKKAME
jgi:hypothetical protein